MFFSVVLSYLPYALVTSFTPGPNNILAFHTVGQKGWVQGRSTLAGIVAGFFSVMAVCALGCYQLERLLPALTQVLPFAGALYLFWLALHLLRSTPAKDVSPRSTFLSGFFSSLSTGKLFCTPSPSIPATSCPPAAAPCSPYSPLSSPSSALRVFSPGQRYFGGLLQSFLRRHTRAFNGAMAMLALCALDLLFEPVAPIKSPMALGQTEPQQPGRPLVRRRQAHDRLPVPGKARAVCLTEPGSATESGHRAHWRKSHRPAPGQPR